MPTNINEVFFDREIAHQIFVQDYKSNIRDNIYSINPSWDDVNFSSRRSWGEALGARWQSIIHTITQGREDFLFDELKFQQDNIRTRWYKPNRVEISQVRKAINTPGLNDRLLNKELDSIRAQEVRRTTQRLRREIARGASRQRLIAIASKSDLITKNQASALVATELTRTSSIVKQQVAIANGEFIKGFLFTAILDSATTQICRSNHNRFVKIDETRYVPPLHFGCRSTLVPVTFSRAELEKNGLSPPSDLITSLPRDKDLDAWFARQSFQTQVQLLGSERMVAFWQDGISLQQLLTRQGSVRSIASVRRDQSLITRLIPFSRRIDDELPEDINISRPVHLINSSNRQRQLRELYEHDSTLDLINYRGTTIAGKRATLRKPDELHFDPITGASRSNRLYDPDFQLLQERLDFVRASKGLSVQQRDWIIKFVNDSEELGINKQTAIVENLRIILERYNRDKRPWDNFEAVVRNELRYSVVNTSRLLDRRSRRDSEYWLRYTGDEKPGVYVNNNLYTLEQLHNNQRFYEIETENWIRNTATREARLLSLKGRAPVFTYFLEPIRAPTPRAIRKLIMDKLDELRLLPDKLLSIPTIARNYVSEKIQSFIDIEAFFLRRLRVASLEYLKLRLTPRLSPRLDAQLRSAVLDVAGGLQTDYDGLAITIGRKLYLNYFKDFTKRPATLRTYHRAGSLVLSSLEARGIIRVNQRGTVRRSIVDLDTGRAAGAWKDTVSREVELIDPRFKRFAELQRIGYITRQLGQIDNRHRLTAKIGEKTYFDRRGRKTAVPITTRDAFERFKATQVDRDIVNMINHANSVRYAVDPDHVEFMYRVYSFRDPRGRTAYYDSLNGFREEIVRRGQIGYALMETVRYYNDLGRPFTLLTRIDSRGRLYYQGFLTPTGGEVVRPFLNAAVERTLTRDGYEAIQSTIGAMLGDANQRLNYPVRLQVFRDNRAAVVELGRIMASKTQLDRRVREFLQHPLIRHLEPEEVNKFARLALEVYRIETHRGRQPYKTKLLVEVDASASGLQLMSLVTGDRGLAEVGNLFPLPAKRRIYDLVAQDTVNDPRWRAISQQLGVDLSWEEVAKVAKYQVLLTAYGAGRTGLRARAVSDIAKILNKQDIDVITRPQQLALLKEVDREIRTAERFSTPETVENLLAFREELDEFLKAGDNYAQGLALLHEAQDFPEIYRFLDDFTANYKPRLTAQKINDLADLLSEKLYDYSSVPSDFTIFHKKVAQRFVEETGKIEIPWVTFDNKVFLQNYRPKVQYEVRFFDPLSKRYIRNIYQRRADSGKLQGKAGIGDVRLGWGVNGVHSLDASVVRQFHLWGRRNNVGTSTIHDAIYVHTNDVNSSIQVLDQIYGDFAEFPQLRRNLRNLRRAGLSRKSYNEFLQEAEELGFLSRDFTKAEIIAQGGPGEYRYAWDF